MRWKPLTIFLCLFALAAQPAWAGLFGSQESRRDGLRDFTKWTGMWERYDSGEAQAAPCAPQRLCRDSKEWRDLVESLRGLPKRMQIERVNAEMNRSPYITDLENWGLPDYWATLYEFIRRDGDCEDYAISKYITLRALGFPPSAMRIAVVQDENIDAPHAVLTLEFEGRTLVLDNQIPQVLPDSAILHYRPIYSINEQAWWLHRPRLASR